MAAKSNIVIEQGATFTQSFVVANSAGTVQDLTDYTVRAQMREEYADVSETVAFSADISTPATVGTVVISLTAAQTELIESGQYVYDVEVINTTNDAVTRIVQGIATVYPQVTKDSGPGGGSFAA